MSERSQRPVWLGEDHRRWDHVRIHLALLHDPAVGANEQAIYLGLAMHAELGSGTSFPSLETLAGYAKCSVKTARRAVFALRDANWISIQERPGSSNVYLLLPPPPLPKTTGVVVNTPPKNDRTPLPKTTRDPSQKRPTNKNHEPEPNNESISQGGRFWEGSDDDSEVDKSWTPGDTHPVRALKASFKTTKKSPSVKASSDATTAVSLAKASGQ